MKVKNIMFSGFMAAIMMSATAGVANAAVSVASRGYVDSKTVNASYTTDSTNYLGSVTGVKNATVELDKQIKSVSDVANAAVSTGTFEEFKTGNTTAIEKAADDAQAAAEATAAGALADYAEVNDAAVKANTDALAVLNGDKTVNGSVDFKIDELNTRLSTESGNAAALAERVTGLEGEIDANTAGLAKLNGDESTDGSVAKSIADAVSTLETKTDAAQKLTDAKAYTDTKVGEVNTALGDYAKTADMTSAIATAKGEAIDAAAGDATTKAGQALIDAKAYTAEEMAKLSALAKADFPQACTAGDKMCVLTLTKEGAYAWVALTEPSEDQ